MENYLERQIRIVKRKQTIREFAFEESKDIDGFIYDSENLRVGDIILEDFRKRKLYIVKPNDTIKTICQKFSLTEKDFFQKNKTERVFVGMRVEV